MAVAALIVSLLALAGTVWFAVRTERWRRDVSRQEARDRKEALLLERHAQTHTEGGWRRFGPGPPPPPPE
jgi:hypothetical protein